MDMQRCSRCCEFKPAEEYSPRYRGKAGSWCRACFGAHRRGEPRPPKQPLPTQQCEVCGKQYQARQYRSVARYCSRACQDKFTPSKRASYLVRKYGITSDDYDAMLLAQGGGCAFCARKPEEQKRYSKYLHVDHDHNTGRVRGLLCGDCNLALGRLGDSPNAIRRVLTYLEAGVPAV